MKLSLGIFLTLLTFILSRKYTTRDNTNIMVLDSIKVGTETVRFKINQVKLDASKLQTEGLRLILSKTSPKLQPALLKYLEPAIIDKDGNRIHYLPLRSLKVIGETIPSFTRDVLELRLSKFDYTQPLTVSFVSQFFQNKVTNLYKVILEQGRQCNELMEGLKVDFLKNSSLYMYYYYNRELHQKNEGNLNQYILNMKKGLETVKKCISAKTFNSFIKSLETKDVRKINRVRRDLIEL